MPVRGKLRAFGQVFRSHRYRPHEILLFLASAVLGGAWLNAAPPPESVATAQPAWVLHFWAAFMLFSGIVGLIATIAPRETYRTLRLELGALLVGSATMVIYTASLVTVVGVAALGPLITFGLWALANLARVAQIMWQVRKWSRL